MAELNDVLLEAIYNELDAQIYGHIEVSIDSDTLSVVIIHDDNGWRCWIEDIYKMALIGVSAKYISNYIVRQYRKYILLKHFK